MPNTAPYDANFTVPERLHIDRLSFTAGVVTIYASTTDPAPECPLCKQPSRRIHGCYTRTLADLPWCGTPVRLRVLECASSSATFPPASAGSSRSVWRMWPAPTLAPPTARGRRWSGLLLPWAVKRERGSHASWASS